MASGLGGCCCQPVQSCTFFKAVVCTPLGKTVSCAKTVVTGTAVVQPVVVSLPEAFTVAAPVAPVDTPEVVKK